MYHYTNFDGLFKIITKRTIKFNRLDFVDDLTESKRLIDSDYSKYCYVSCWTNKKRENIALWEMYSKNMEGFCIYLPDYPFVFKNDDKKIYSFKEIIALSKKEKKISTYFPDVIFDLMQEGMYTWDGLQVYNGRQIEDHSFLYSMNYVKKYDEKFLDPFVDFKFKNGKETLNSNILIGKQKHKDWSFQKEKRYLIDLKLCKERTHFGLQENMRDLYKKNSESCPKCLFLNIHESSFMSMKIIAGPKCKKESKDEIKYILLKEGLNIKVEDSIWKNKIKV